MMLTIRDVMCDCAVTIHPDDTLIEAVRVLCEHHLSGAPVMTSGGEIVGFISEPGLMDVLFDEKARRATVSDYMNRDVHCVHPDDSISDAAAMFALYRVRRLPVVENGLLLGVVTRRDLLQCSLTGAEPIKNPLFELIPAIGQHA